MDGPLAYLRHIFLFFFGKSPQHIIDLGTVGEVVSDSDTDAGIVPGPESFFDMAQSVVTTVAPALTHTQSTEWQVDVIAYDKQPVDGDRQFG